MSKKNVKCRKLPITFNKFSNISMREHHEKIISQFEKWAAAYAGCCNKADRKMMRREDFLNLMTEALNLSRISQEFITIAVKNHGRHYCITEQQVYKKE